MSTSTSVTRTHGQFKIQFQIEQCYIEMLYDDVVWRNLNLRIIRDTTALGLHFSEVLYLFAVELVVMLSVN